MDTLLYALGLIKPALIPKRCIRLVSKSLAEDINDAEFAKSAKRYAQKQLNFVEYHAKQAVQRAALVQKILESLQQAGEPMKMKDIAKLNSTSVTSARPLCMVLVDQGKLKRTDVSRGVAFVAVDPCP